MIDYLGVNDHDVREDRRKLVARLVDIFDAARWTREERLAHLAKYPGEASYPTALGACLGLDLVAD